MASPLATEYPSIPTPPPAYLRSSPPFPSQHSTPRSPQSLNIARKSVPAGDSEETPVIQESPRSPVKIDHSAQLPPASSAQIEQLHNGPPTPQLELPEFAGMSIEGPAQPEQSWNPAYPPRRESAQASQYQTARQHPYGHTPASSGSWSVIEPHGEDNGSENRKHSTASLERGDLSHNNSSRGSSESVAQTVDSFEPLTYHHQRLEQQSQQAKRQSTPGMVLPDYPSSSTDKLAARRSRIARPLSNYSNASDLAVGGHRRNLSASPYLHGRSSSRNSTASPDNRSSSFLDLLNTSYPQPGPTVPKHDNVYLRGLVGNNASLLSHRETFEAYLKNLERTNDPAVQYEFAIFMINSMRDMPSVDLDDSTSITRSRLMRESKAILTRLSERSYPFAQYYLADGYASGLFNKGKEDYGRAFPLFVSAGKHGHIEACYRAALCYEFGWGCRFYRQAASKNHPGAMLRMANACLAGDMGLGKRYREGIKWMKRATETADAQYPSAPYELGLMHETGYGDDVFIDESYAAQLFTKAAELGHTEAAYRLGDAYEHGRLNCPRDPALSIHFYTIAAQGGHPLAMMALCAWYLVGAEPVLEKDENEAYEWAAKAAGLGLAKAQYAVGYFTEMGIGCRRDPLEANVWYVKAADQGDERAKYRIAAIRAAADGANPAHAARHGRFRKSDKGQGKSKSSLISFYAHLFERDTDK
ncbi:hypothetical protein N7532_010012 [Penicillium argentinense]|uniref:Chitin synthase activator n=1 Tax=Penicillium argentinense TaxID=1131581 RepID=A0A9W9EP35_9EURO|nr:uncharacterized protein N7532_010012 [Penicillium argentinense]KAJ5085241.1 hypothetical protein N7532_010012 [Penicillium argentinense]